MNYLVDREKIIESMKDLKFELTEVKDLFLFDENKHLIVLREAVNYPNEFNKNVDTLVFKSNGEVESIDYSVFSEYLDLKPDSSTSTIQEYDDAFLYFYKNNLTILTLKENQLLPSNSDFVIKDVDDSFVFKNSLDKNEFSYE